jgi:diguanylate cyclase (GGDEF)-like protein
MTTQTLALIFFLLFLAATTAAVFFYSHNLRLKKVLMSLGQLDQTTQLPDRTAAYRRLQLLYATAQRYRQPLTLALLHISRNDADLQQPQALPDTHIARIAAELREQLRGTDLLGRVDSEVFLIALTHTNTHDSRAVFERILTALSKLRLKPQEYRYAIGVSHLTTETQSLKQLLDNCQQALEEAQSSSINQVQYRPSRTEVS